MNIKSPPLSLLYPYKKEHQKSPQSFLRIKELLEMESENQIILGLDNSLTTIGIENLSNLLIFGVPSIGKTNLIKIIISNILCKYTFDEFRFIIFDSKEVDYSELNAIPYLLTPVLTNSYQLKSSLEWACRETVRRLEMIVNNQKKNIDSYNSNTIDPLEKIIIIIDEYNKNSDIEFLLLNILDKGPIVGIYTILSATNPSNKNISYEIKSLVPYRISFFLSSPEESEMALGIRGAEKLETSGTAIIKNFSKKNVFKVGFVEDEEMIRITDFIKAQFPSIENIKKVPRDQNPSLGIGSILEQAIRITVQYQKGSASFLQRKLNVGFTKAAELVEELEMLGVVGPQNGSKPREVLISDAEAFLAEMKGGE